MKDFHLADGDLLIMGGNMQQEYKHSVPPRKRLTGRRINLTIRAFVDNRRELGGPASAPMQ